MVHPTPTLPLNEPDETGWAKRAPEPAADVPRTKVALDHEGTTYVALLKDSSDIGEEVW